MSLLILNSDPLVLEKQAFTWMGNVCIDAYLCIYVYMNKYLTCVLCVYKMCSD